MLSLISKLENYEVYVLLVKKETSKILNQKLLQIVKKKVSEEITIVLENSYHEKGLQAVDFIAWAVFQKYQRKNGEFYNLLKDKISKEIFYK